ncbi:MAG: ABC transporter permease [Cytophagales bacterium]
MDKIWLILQREYLTRVKKKSFIIMTILTPVLFGAMIFFVAWFSTKKGDKKVIEVLDDSGYFEKKLKSNEEVNFVYIGGDLEKAKADFEAHGSFGLLYIPKIDIDKPDGLKLYSGQNPSFDLVNMIKGQVSEEIRQLRIADLDIDETMLDKLNVDVNLKTLNMTETGEKESNAGVNFGIGYIASFLIYIFIFLYGAQVMRGVIEEKSSRIVEVIISSVKPFQLMMGKVLGVAAVGLTQFVIWVILMSAVSASASTFTGINELKDNPAVTRGADVDFDQMENNEEIAGIFRAIENIPIAQIISLFIFYFLGGYLVYASLFAMVGSAVDSEADSQQFMLPITIPLLLAIFSLGPVLSDPNSQLAFWLSMIPFTSPVVMMGRIAYGVPGWEIALSMLLLIGGFILTTWVAARVYRVGILIHGTKVNYKVLVKWFFQN